MLVLVCTLNQEGVGNMRDLRTTFGVALSFSLLMVFVSGFLATSRQDVILVIVGYALGLFAVYFNDRLKVSHARGKAELSHHRD
mgnify:CR=1 FL=1